MEMEFRPTKIVEVKTEASRRLTASRAEHYLHGPIRMNDIQAAAKLPGSCLAVLLAIHFRRAVTRQKAVTLPSGLLSNFGIDAAAKMRALRHLESATLIQVTRTPGKTAVVELMERHRPARQGEA
jgi:hypothetical protein